MSDVHSDNKLERDTFLEVVVRSNVCDVSVGGDAKDDRYLYRPAVRVTWNLSSPQRSL